MRKPSNNDMENIAEDAEAAFWAVVAKAGKKYGANTGDMDPGAAFKFEHECMAAVKIWFEYNLNESTDMSSTTLKLLSKENNMNFSIKSFEQFLAEDTGWKVEVHKTDLKSARIAAQEQLSKKHKDLDETIPDFDKNYTMLRKAVDNSWGVARKDMPVINDNQIHEFQKLLKDGALDILKPFAKGHMLTDKEVQHLDDKSEFVHLGFKDGKDGDDKLNAKVTTRAVKDLKPIQQQIYLDKVADMIAQWGPATQGSPVTKLTLIISKEGYILDGHHRFACALLSNPNLKMSVLEVPMNIDELLKLTLAYGDAIGNPRNV